MSCSRVVNIVEKPDIRKEVLKIFMELAIIQAGDTGNITVHLNNGQVAKITKQVEVR